MSELVLTKKLSPETILLIQRWVNLHRVLWVLTLGCFFSAWNRGLALLYGVSSLILALILISYVLPRLQLRGIKVVRSLTGNLAVGQSGSLTYHLRSPGQRFHIELSDNLPFVNDDNNRHLFFGRIDGELNSELQFVCEHRGCFKLDKLRLVSAYPFGVIKHEKEISTTPLDVLVFPAVFTLKQIPLPVLADSSSMGSLSIPHQGGHEEFSGVREYRQGDELKRIHWSASARYQHLVVKEYERTDKPRLLIALDCNPAFSLGVGKINTFEYAISIAASLIRYATRQGMQCCFFADDGQPREMVVPAYSADLYALYELLARLKSTGANRAEDIIDHAQQCYPQANLLVTFRLSGNDYLADVGPQATLVDIAFDEKSFRNPVQVTKKTGFYRSGARLCYSVAASTDLESLFQ